MKQQCGDLYDNNSSFRTLILFTLLFKGIHVINYDIDESNFSILGLVHNYFYHLKVDCLKMHAYFVCTFS